MSNVLIVAEQSGGHLRKATLHAIAAGQALAGRTGGKLHVAAPRQGRRRALAERARRLRRQPCTPPTRAGLEHYLAEAFAPVVAELAKAVGADLRGRRRHRLRQGPRCRASPRASSAAMATEVLGFAGAGADVTFHPPDVGRATCSPRWSWPRR